VYGPKGSGKSALYSLLRLKKDALAERGIIPARGESIRGTPVFEDLVPDPPTSEDQFRGLWKVYFLSLAGSIIEVLELKNESAQRLSSALEEAGLVLLPPHWSLKRMLKAALDYVRRVELTAPPTAQNRLLPES
jgi:hypothetical protein